MCQYTEKQRFYTYAHCTPTHIGQTSLYSIPFFWQSETTTTKKQTTTKTHTKNTTTIFYHTHQHRKRHFYQSWTGDENGNTVYICSTSVPRNVYKMEGTNPRNIPFTTCNLGGIYLVKLYWLHTTPSIVWILVCVTMSPVMCNTNMCYYLSLLITFFRWRVICFSCHMHARTHT